ncbi:MAG: hypothetical protein IPJ34_24140 [Myxococcales bacterium]|nr:hypothetical protein [Myxococcales bacterium]
MPTNHSQCVKPSNHHTSAASEPAISAARGRAPRSRAEATTTGNTPIETSHANRLNARSKRTPSFTGAMQNTSQSLLSASKMAPDGCPASRCGSQSQVRPDACQASTAPLHCS